MRQQLAHELLDDDQGAPAEIRRSLDELWWINQHLGGLSTWPRLLARWWEMDAAPRSVATLLDVGAGTGQLAAAHAAWFARRGARVEAFALDRRASHLGPHAAGLVADAFQLPFADASLDLVTCNLFLHHFHDLPAAPAATQLLMELWRVARRAVLINDLERAWPPYLTIQLLGLGLSRITRHDGPRSVRQAYTRRELQALGRRTGIGNCEVRRLWPYRLGMILWR